MSLASCDASYYKGKSLDSSYWKKMYRKDKKIIEDELKKGISLKEARSIGYQHQYAYQRSPEGKAIRENYLTTPKGCESKKKAAKKYYTKMKNDHDFKVKVALRSKKYRENKKLKKSQIPKEA